MHTKIFVVVFLDVLELVDASHHHSRDKIRRLARRGSHLLDHSRKEFMDRVTNALVEFVVLDSRREKSVHGCMEDHRIGILVEKDNVINVQLVISFRLLIRI